MMLNHSAVCRCREDAFRNGKTTAFALAPALDLHLPSGRRGGRRRRTTVARSGAGRRRSCFGNRRVVVMGLSGRRVEIDDDEDVAREIEGGGQRDSEPIGRLGGKIFRTADRAVRRAVLDRKARSPFGN